MISWLYKRSRLYRSLFEEELMLRRVAISHKKQCDRIYEELNRTAKFYHKYMNDGDYESALKSMGYYLYLYSKLK